MIKMYKYSNTQKFVHKYWKLCVFIFEYYSNVSYKYIKLIDASFPQNAMFILYVVFWLIAGPNSDTGTIPYLPIFFPPTNIQHWSRYDVS